MYIFLLARKLQYQQELCQILSYYRFFVASIDKTFEFSKELLLLALVFFIKYFLALPFTFSLV